MAIKAGQILHVANQFVVDRIQTAGPGDLNIPQDRVFELGNYQSVGIVRGVPDLSFNLECLDVDTEVEAILTGADPTVAVTGVASPHTAGTMYELLKTVPIDITSPWKTPYGTFDAVKGVVIPNLGLASAAYRYGLTDNAGETFTLNGDSIYYVPGTPWQDAFLGSTLTAGLHAFAKSPALPYKEGGKTFYALCVSVDGVRQTAGDTYTETATGITFTGTPPAAGAKISVCYGSATVGTYPQVGQDPYGTGTGHLVHQTVAVKPAAIRGKDIDVYFSTDTGGGPVEVRWDGVQSATVDWSQTLEQDYEFGNARAVSRDATDIPGVTGSVEIRAQSVERLFARISQITGVPVTEVIGPQSAIIGALRIEIRNPEVGGITGTASGTVLKTHYVPDARFTVPGYSAAVQQKLNSTVNFTSDTGTLQTFKGTR